MTLPSRKTRQRPTVLLLACAVLLSPGAFALDTLSPTIPVSSNEFEGGIATSLGSRPLNEVDLTTLRTDAQSVVTALGDNTEGEVYSGAVEGTDPDDLAVAIVLIDGRTVEAGKAETRFPLMSVSKPFTYALAVEQRGGAFMAEKIGVVATGMPYNEVAAGEVRGTTEQNPLVNAGAIATHSFIEGETSDQKIGAVVDLYSKLADTRLKINEDWRAEPRALTYTLAYQMQSQGRLDGDVADVAERYLEACIVGVTVEELARMGAVLAAGGVRPGTGTRVLAEDTVRQVLSVMVIAGMYEDSGDWWTRVGLPAKSGVSGAILAVVPGWGAIVAYSPRLDAAGNSVRAALAIEMLTERWGLHSLERLLRSGADAGSHGPG
jgi:glutaminase